MNWLLFLAIFAAVEAGLPPEVVKALSLRCLLEDTFDPCKVLPETSYKNITTTFSPKFLDELASLPPEFFKGVDKQNFSSFNQDVLDVISDPLYFFLPANHLSQIDKDLLINLIIQRSDSKVIKQFAKAYFLENGMHYFDDKIDKLDLPSKALKWLADVVSTRQIITSEPLIFYAPPYTIPLNRTDEKLFYLALHQRFYGGSYFSRTSMRFWIYTLTRKQFPGPLRNWNDICFGRFGVVIPGATAYELRGINESTIKTTQRLFDLKFSPIQMRTLFDEYADRIMTGKVFNLTSSKIYVVLLPKQLLSFSEKVTYLEQLKVLPPFKSQAVSKQIFELLLYKKSKILGSYPYINNYSYVWPLKELTHFAQKSLRELIDVQSSYLSKNQLFILTSGGWPFHFNTEIIFDCKEFAKILPASDIIINETASHILMHLLANIDAKNPPQSFAVMNQLWSIIGLPNAFKKILANRDAGILLEYIPSRHITRFVNNITLLAEKGNIPVKLPDIVVSTILQQFKAADVYFSLLDVIEPLAFLFDGVSCVDVQALDPYDFVYFMIRYKDRRKAARKNFPKKLQQCCVEKFTSYLELKSEIFQRYIGENKLSLLNEAEIDAIGGNIFAALPTKAIETAKHYKFIIKAIGELPMSELISSTVLSKLQEFTYILISESLDTAGKIGNTLFDLGNLTLFLELKYIFKMSDTAFKLMLESNYIDRRICIDKATRDVWFYFIRGAFGEPSTWTYQTLISLGDLLVVVPPEDLEDIPQESWIYAIDVLYTGYFEEITLYHTTYKYYEVCMLQLDYEEAETYSLAVGWLMKKYVDAAQLQLDTVTPADSMGRNSGKNAEVFTFLNSRSSKIKMFIPTVNNLINTSNSMNYSGMSIQTTEQEIRGESQFSTVEYDDEFYSTTEFTDSFFNNNEHVTDKTPIVKDFVPNVSIMSEDTNIVKETSEQTNDYSSNFYFNENYSELNQDVSTPTSSEVVEFDNVTLNAINNFTVSNTVIKSSTVSNGISDEYLYSSTPLYATSNTIHPKQINEKIIERPSTQQYISSSTENLSTEDGDSKDMEHVDLHVPEVSKDMFTLKDSSDIIINNNHETMNKTVYNVSNEYFTVKESNAMTQSPSAVTNNKSKSTQSEPPTKTSYSDVTDYSTLPMTKTTISTYKNETTFQGEEHINGANENIPLEIKEVKIERLLNDDSAKTELMNFNFSYMNSKFKNKVAPVVIGEEIRKRTKRSPIKWSCNALKMVGKPIELMLTSSMIIMMSENDINECLELFSDLNLSRNVTHVIWTKMNPELSFMSGKVIRAITLSEVESKNLSISNRWALETIHIIGKYSPDIKIRQHIVKEVLKTPDLRFSVEILVTLGSLVCELPEISPDIIEPSEFLKASVILGRTLPCNHSCLAQLSNIAIHKEAFKTPSKWTAEDVSNLGIVVAGLDQENWIKLITSDKYPLHGISETTFQCLQLEHLKELEKVSPGGINITDTFNTSITYDFFGPPPRSDLIRPRKPSSSNQLIDFYVGFYFQLFISLFSSVYFYYIVV